MSLCSFVNVAGWHGEAVTGLRECQPCLTQTHISGRIVERFAPQYPLTLPSVHFQVHSDQNAEERSSSFKNVLRFSFGFHLIMLMLKASITYKDSMLHSYVQ